MICRARDDAAIGERRDRHADDGVVHGQQHDRDRHFPENVEMAGEVVERTVTDEHAADEQHDLGQKGERKEDRRDRAELGQHVVDAGDRPSEHQREHVLTAVRAHDIGRNQRDEQQQCRRHADVVAVGDDLDPLGEEAVARHIPDADVDDRRDRDDAEEHERCNLLAPRPPDTQRAAHRRFVQGEGRRTPLSAWSFVRAVAPVVDGTAASGLDDVTVRPRRGS